MSSLSAHLRPLVRSATRRAASRRSVATAAAAAPIANVTKKVYFDISIGGVPEG